MKSTNRIWQKHLSAKGVIPFFLDRLQQHALSNNWQYSGGAFNFPIDDRETEDELSRAYFEFVEDFPYEFYIEITNRCNLDCDMCARPEMTRKLGAIDIDLYKKVIDEIAENQPHAFIHYYGIGESTLDRTLFDKLEYSRSKGLRNSLLFTNGQTLLKKDLYKKLVDSGLTNIGVDLDGFSPEVYEKIRIGGDFEKVKTGIEKMYAYARETNSRVRIELAYQVVPDISDKDLPLFVDWCDKNGYEYKIVTMHNWAGLREDVSRKDAAGVGSMHHAERQGPCSYQWNGFTITWDGRVAKCFQDADVRESMGDLNHQTIKEVWTGRMRDERRAQIRGGFSGICGDCTSGANVRLPEFKSNLYPEALLAE